ncbi:MAG: TetR/AcrR family transcriptional regulator [Candidatus Acididesulfobacter guangdongensis]|uniref:TetR/AcrR family transcriptional regulator n=1 Tax=Acididesulfobacter guangdongensis TaxID=2597225 RepID=A0A519BGA8_ACIG2|nr:MAG: TetR/AcrR family transcriptional regulator [Candidatus Acididesulfobacter guangdongensis]
MLNTLDVKLKDRKRIEIIDAAYALMLEKGYEDMGLQDIINNISATKGCIYYYFKSKKDIAAAVIEEIIKPFFESAWSSVYEFDDPIDGICRIIDDVYLNSADNLAKTGCPLGNLILELSAKDPTLSILTNEIMITWHDYINKAIRIAKTKKIVKQELNESSIANFIIASFEGCIMIAKSNHSKEVLKDCFSVLKEYLQLLKCSRYS